MIQQIVDQLEDLFMGMGYQVLSGPEVEEDKYNFEMMNLPKDHPARDMQDTFYITKEILMRTQTSPMQARTLETHDFSKGPLKMISPGSFTVVIRMIQPTLINSTRWKGLSSISTLPWLI